MRYKEGSTHAILPIAAGPIAYGPFSAVFTAFTSF